MLGLQVIFEDIADSYLVSGDLVCSYSLTPGFLIIDVLCLSTGVLSLTSDDDVLHSLPLTRRTGAWPWGQSWSLQAAIPSG